MMKKMDLVFFIMIAVIIITIAVKVLPLYLSEASPYSFNDLSDNNEKRGTPIYAWVKGSDNLPHMKIYFWIPKTSCYYLPYADKGIKTYVTGHGPVKRWGVKETGEYTKTEKLICIYIPKTFVILYGKDFYKLIHLYYK
jgi:hypothetical protein